MADRFWVGGTANWDGTAGTKWALTSGGAGGQSVPTNSDDVFFDAASGAAICIISTGNLGAKTLNCTGFTGTLAGSAVLNTFGNITLGAGMTNLYNGTIAVNAATIITSNGKPFPGNLALQAGGGVTTTLGDALVVAGSIQMTQGNLDLNGFPCSAGSFGGNSSNFRSIIFGAQNITLTSTTANDVIIFMSTATSFSWTGTGGFVRNMGAAATVDFGTTAGGSTANAPNLTVNGGASNLTIAANSWLNNLSFTGSTCVVLASNVNIAGNLTLATGGTYTSFVPTYRDTGTITSAGKTISSLTVNGSGVTVTCADALNITNALTLTAGTLKLKESATSTVGSFVTTGTTLKYLQSATAGVRATISAAAGLFAATYLSIKDSNATGGATWDALSPTNVNAGNNIGWLFPTSGNMFFLF